MDVEVVGIVVIGVFGMVVIGVTGFITGTEELFGAGVGVATVVLPGPIKLAARIYWVSAACCSGVAVLFATA